jgi:hypothetical protein
VSGALPLPSGVHPATEAAATPPFATHDEPGEIARHLEAESPNWLVLWGVYTHQFVAFPRFDAPPGTIVTAIYPDALVGRTREAERRLHRYREHGEK